jgi:hypothetical protein
MGLIFVEIAS